MKARKIAAILAVGALAVAACGDDDDDTATTEAATATTAAEEEDTATTAAPEEGEEEDTATTAAAEEDTATTAAAEEEEEEEDTATTAAAEEDGEAFAIDVSECEDPDAATAPIEGAVKIGNSYPQSGGPAVLFAPFGDGMKAYIDYYNAEKGGINGEPIELISKDDQYMADLTKTAVDGLVFDDEVHIIAGVIGSANNAVIQADLNAQCIPQMWAATGSTLWGNIDEYPWTSGLLVPYAIEVETFLQYAAEQFPDGGTLGFFYVNNEFGQEYKNAVDARAAEYGFEVVAEETIDATDSGAPSGQMTNLVAANPDAIIAVPLGAGCISFMTELGNAQAANADFDPLVYLTGTCASTVFYNAVTNGGNDGVFTASQFKDVANEELQTSDADIAEYLEAFAASGSAADPSGLAAAGWVAGEATVKAIEDALATGTLSRETIANAVRNIDFRPSLIRDGLNFRMNASDAYAAEGATLIQWSVADAGFVDVGEPVTFDGFLGVYTG
jgi:branched-chain amino acid transport system substrate-binding protein